MTVSVPNLPTQPGFIHLSDEERKVRGAHIPPISEHGARAQP